MEKVRHTKGRKNNFRFRKKDKSSCINGSRRKVWAANDYRNSSELHSKITIVLQDISRAALESNFGGMEEENISKNFSFHHHEFLNE